MVWEGISLEGCTDLHLIASGTMAAVRYQVQMLDNAHPHVARVCKQFLDDEGTDATDWPSHSPDSSLDF